MKQDSLHESATVQVPSVEKYLENFKSRLVPPRRPRRSSHLLPCVSDHHNALSEEDPNQTFPALLLSLKKKKFTGTLSLVAENSQTILHFENGDPFFAELGDANLSLGQLLLQSKRISQEQYEQVISWMTESILDNEDKRMGECLIELGIMSESEVYEALQFQLHEKINACFAYQAPQYCIRSNTEADKDSSCIKTNPLELIISEGIKRHLDESRLNKLFSKHIDLFPYLTANGRFQAICLGITEEEHRFILAIHGQTTLRSQLQTSSLSFQEGLRLAATLYFIGGLRFSHLQKNDDELDDISEQECCIDPQLSVSCVSEYSQPFIKSQDIVYATSRQKRTQKGRHKKYLKHPKKVPFSRLHSQTAEQNRRFQHLGSDEYQNIFTQSEKKQPTNVRRWFRKKIMRDKKSKTDKEREASPAQQAFRVGEHFLRYGWLKEASYHFQKAIDQDREEPIFKLFSAWTEYRLSEDKTTKQLYQSIARELAIKVLSRYDHHAKAHFILAHFYRLENMRENALNHLQQATALDPSDIEAKRELILLTQKVESSAFENEVAI